MPGSIPMLRSTASGSGHRACHQSLSGMMVAGNNLSSAMRRRYSKWQPMAPPPCAFANISCFLGSACIEYCPPKYRCLASRCPSRVAPRHPLRVGFRLFGLSCGSETAQRPTASQASPSAPVGWAEERKPDIALTPGFTFVLANLPAMADFRPRVENGSSQVACSAIRCVDAAPDSAALNCLRTVCIERAEPADTV